MNVRMSLTLETTEMFLSLRMIFSLHRAAVAWAILEMISGLDPSLEMIDHRFLKFPTALRLWPFILISLLFVITFVLSGPVSILYLVVVVRIKTFYQDVSFSYIFCIYNNAICKAEVCNKPSSDANTS